MFIGRKAELQLLEDAYQGAQSAFVPIYGRRRVGKSELIIQLLKDKRGLYFLGKVAPPALQIREFLAEAAWATQEPLLASLPAESWKAALVAAEERWRGPGKLVLALDEFQWMAHASPELPSVLQELWDRRWRASGRVLLILCGSFIGFMEREVLGRQSPLFGRRTAQIHLRAFGYREAAEFHPSWSLMDRAAAYFVCGGVPLYLLSFDAAASFESNLERHVLSEFGALHREPEFLLREELRDVVSYHAVLTALAAGATTGRAIATETGLAERSLHYYIDQLAALGYLARRHPLTEARPTRRAVRYVLDDPLLRFWFRHVFPHLSFLQQRGPQRTFRELIRPELEAYFGSCFERLCREALPAIYAREGVSAPFEVGEYWDKEVQIDVVGLRDDHWTDLGECKWGRVTSVAKLQQELERKLPRYPNRRGATLGRLFFTRVAPTAKPASDRQARWYSLEQLYGAE